MSAVHGDKLTGILDAAFRLFGTKGFYETKMSEIADEAGIAKGTLYLYFTSKEQLFTAVTKRDFGAFLEELDQRLASGEQTLEGQLKAVADHHLSYYYRQKPYPRLFFQSPNNDQSLLDAMSEFLDDYKGRVAAIMERFGSSQARLHANSFIGILDMFKMDILFTDNFTFEQLEQRVSFAVKLFVNGFESQ